MVMSREAAQEVVDRVTVQVGQYQGVCLSDVDRLLGDREVLLRDDPIRRLGPSVEFVYPWNVVDYLSNENPRGASFGKAVRDATELP